MNQLPTPPSGFKASETYMGFLGALSGLGIAFGFLTTQEGELLLQALGAIIGGVITLGSVIIQVKGRLELKKQYIQAGNVEKVLDEAVGGTTNTAQSDFTVIPR